MRGAGLQRGPSGLGLPAEVAATALFFASDDSCFFVGQVLMPNGGIDM